MPKQMITRFIKSLWKFKDCCRSPKWLAIDQQAFQTPNYLTTEGTKLLLLPVLSCWNEERYLGMELCGKTKFNVDWLLNVLRGTLFINYNSYLSLVYVCYIYSKKWGWSNKSEVCPIMQYTVKWLSIHYTVSSQLPSLGKCQYWKDLLSWKR